MEKGHGLHLELMIPIFKPYFSVAHNFKMSVMGLEQPIQASGTVHKHDLFLPGQLVLQLYTLDCFHVMNMY